MFIQINTDNQVPSDAERDARLEEQIRQRLAYNINPMTAPMDVAYDNIQDLAAEMVGKGYVLAEQGNGKIIALFASQVVGVEETDE